MESHESETQENASEGDVVADETQAAYAWQLEPPAELAEGGHSRHTWSISIAALLAAVVALSATIFGLRWTHGSERGATASTAPVPTASMALGPILDGIYEIDSDNAHETVNGTLFVGEDTTRWWAFRSICGPAECVATSSELSETNHLTLSDDHDHSVFRWRDGAWREDQIMTVSDAAQPQTRLRRPGRWLDHLHHRLTAHSKAPKPTPSTTTHAEPRPKVRSPNTTFSRSALEMCPRAWLLIQQQLADLRPLRREPYRWGRSNRHPLLRPAR